MTVKGLTKLLKKPHIFLKDYVSKTKSKDEQKEILHKLIKLSLPFDTLYFFLSKEVSKEKKNTVLEKELLEKAYSIKAKDTYLYKIINILKAKKQDWQTVEAYDKLINSSKSVQVKWRKEYALALAQMHHFEHASQEMKKVIEKSKNADDWFLYGYYLEKINKKSLSDKAYSQAIVFDKTKNAKQYGIGIFFEKKGQWNEAQEKYAKSIEKNPMEAKLRGRHALSYEKLYEWEKAEEEYLKAIGLNPDETPWYYKLGFVQERQGKYEKATEAYGYAARNRETHTPYWYYRLGYVLVKLKKHEEACSAFLMMQQINLSLKSKKNNLLFDNLKKNVQDSSKKLIKDFKNSTNIKNSEDWKTLGYLYFNTKNYTLAANAFKESISRTNDFKADLYFELGKMLTYDESFQEAAEAFLAQRVMPKAHGMVEAPFNKDKTLRNVITYTEFYENLSIQDNSILYESYHGSAMSCSPYAIFKSLLEDERFTDHLHIWVIADENSIKPEYKKHNNVIFIKKNSALYMRYLASAKYLINNTTFPDWYIRKENQIYLNTWHGTPIKTLGRDVENDFMAHKNQTKNFLQTTHIISPNKHTTKVLEESYDIKNIYTGVLATSGYPRQDLMLNIHDEEKESIYSTLKIDKSKTVVLYAPTWRGTVSGATVDIKQLENDMQYMATLENVEILFRGHYMVEKFLKDLNIDITVVPAQIDTNSLLSIIDILVTDYSSICFDFMVMEKPIIYYIYDKEEYLKERGLYFEVETIGDYICYDIDEVKDSIQNIIKDEQVFKLQKKAKSDFCAYDDGLATKRVVDLIFFNKVEKLEIAKQEEKESILIYGGPLMANGITTSFINLCNLIDKRKYTVTITFDPNAVLLEDTRIEQFNKLDREIKVVPRFGKMLMTLEEKELIDRFNSGKSLNGSEMWDIFEYAHRREFKRIFGYAKFDYIINFEGYTVFWSLLMGIKLEGVKSNAIYQHNDLYAEYQMKYSYLKQTFESYRFYDKIVSVSEKTKEHNRNNLSKNFKVDSNKFIHCDNVQDIKNILEKLKKYVQIKSYSKNEIVLQKIKQLKNEDLYFEVIGYSDNINEATSLLFKSRKVFLNEEIRSSVVKASSFKKEGNYFFLTFLVSSEILAFETETVIHSWDVYLDSEKEYRIKCFDKLQMTFKNEHNDLIPYSTKYKNFSIMSIRKKSRKDISEYKKSIVFVLVRIDYQGGVTKVTIDLANILAENGYKVTIVAVNTIISPNSFPISDKVSFDYVSLNIHTNKDIIPGNAYSKVEIMDIIFVEKMKNYFSKLNTDFVYFPIYGSSMFINLLKFIPFNVKKIIGDHSGRRYKIYDKLLQEEKEISCQELGNLTTDYHYLNNLEKINAVHIVNPLVKPIYEQITSKPILGIPNIVSVKENLIEDTKVLNWSKRQKKIIAVGSLTKVKNFHTLIEVFHSVSMEFQDWVLEIYGEGAEKENLQTLIEKLSLTERVYLKGFSRNIIENFKNSMLHVSVSKIESFGLTMVESMSQGTLTLSTYTTIGAKYLLEDNVTGFLAKSNKQEDISVKLKEVLNLIDNSDASIFKIQENAYLKSKQFNASSISKEWDEALLKLN